MSRVVLIHWNQTEANANARLIRGSGHTVRIFSDPDSGRFKSAWQNPPDVFVIDLRRLPSHGRAVAIWVRQQKATRAVPIVIVEGDPAKTELARRLLPDAVFTAWRTVRGAIRRAIAQRPADPVVPGTMAGYAATPLPRKLGIRPDSVVGLLGAPAGFDRTLGVLPPGVRLRKQARGRAAVVLLFVGSRAILKRRLGGADRMLEPGGKFWILWPKKASGIPSDLSQPVVRATGMAAGFVDYKIAAIDATWSGLCFARRAR